MRGLLSVRCWWDGLASITDGNSVSGWRGYLCCSGCCSFILRGTFSAKRHGVRNPNNGICPPRNYENGFRGPPWINGWPARGRPWWYCGWSTDWWKWFRVIRAFCRPDCLAFMRAHWKCPLEEEPCFLWAEYCCWPLRDCFVCAATIKSNVTG